MPAVHFATLLPDLHGVLIWTEHLRMVSALISLCTAGAALVNLEKCYRFANNMDLPSHELIVLHVWAVSVTGELYSRLLCVCTVFYLLTMSRLLSMALLLVVHPYWCLAGVSLHLTLHGVHWYRTMGVRWAMQNVFDICMVSLNLLISPFVEDDSLIYRCGFHVIHFLGNTVGGLGPWYIAGVRTSDLIYCPYLLQRCNLCIGTIGLDNARKVLASKVIPSTIVKHRMLL